jgi:alpha-beta hydrolase superfamily lysophospholipase
MAGGVLAQGGEGLEVRIEASDGLALIGDYYAPPEAEKAGAPAVLLLHQLSSTRRAWAELVPLLSEAGYGVLAVDMRGHGATRGSQDWPLAEEDLHLWLEWLRVQEGIDPAG